MCKCAYPVKLISYLFQGTFWATFDEIWQLSTLVLSLYGNSLSESIFQGGSEGEHLLSDGQAKFDSQTGQRC